MIVMKFGGTSVGSAERMKQVVAIVKSKLAQKPVVVLSAVAGVTDMLINAVNKAAEGAVDIKAIREKHETIVKELGLPIELIKELDEYEGLLKSIAGKGMNSKQMDQAQSYGERVSTKIMAAYMTKTGMPAKAFNAYDIGMVTDDKFGGANLLAESYTNLKQALGKVKEVPIITGFIAKTKNGDITTFGRGGSDYSGAIVGAALDSDEIQIWTDVNGVMSADPKIIPNAHTIAEMSFDEAAELSYFGAKVLHPKTILPAVEKDIPVIVLNTLNPTHPGTRIVAKTAESEEVVKAISYKKNITVINISSTGMINAYGFLAKIFNVFDKYKVPVDMLATSEVSVSLTIDDKDYKVEIINELEQIADVKVERENAIVIVVGEGLKKKISKAAPIFNVLAENNIHVSMISQGASEINLGFVVRMKDAEKAVKMLHKHYFRC